MLLDLNFKITTLEDVEITDKNSLPNILVANLLAMGKTDPIAPAKAISWARDLYKTGQINADKTDLEELQKIVERSGKEGGLTNIAVAPIVDAIKKAKDAA